MNSNIDSKADVKAQQQKKKNGLFAIGIVIGLTVGFATDQLILWLPIGVAIGIALRRTVKDAETESKDEKR